MPITNIFKFQEFTYLIFKVFEETRTIQTIVQVVHELIKYMFQSNHIKLEKHKYLIIWNILVFFIKKSIYESIEYFRVLGIE